MFAHNRMWHRSSPTSAIIARPKVPLDANNRILVANGLARIRQRRCCPGILALYAVAGKQPDRAQSTDLGFLLGPRLNAAGRMDDMRIGIRCLLADDMGEALKLAQEYRQKHSGDYPLDEPLASMNLMQATTAPPDFGKLRWYVNYDNGMGGLSILAVYMNGTVKPI